MNREDRQIIEWAINSLSNNPGAWTRGHYRAEHTSGISVWIANGPSCLRIVTDDNFSHGPGGLNLLGILVPWRFRLWRAAMSIPDNTPDLKSEARQNIRRRLASAHPNT